MIENLDDNSYFKAVIKDAISDLKKRGRAYVFFEEQVDYIKEYIKTKYNGIVKVENDGTIFYISSTNNEHKKWK